MFSEFLFPHKKLFSKATSCKQKHSSIDRKATFIFSPKALALEYGADALKKLHSSIAMQCWH